MPMYIIFALLMAALIGYLYEKYAVKDSYEQFKPPGKRIDIGGQRLYVVIQGERQQGQPLVVLESGHGDWSRCWRGVQPEIARFARVLSYDRAGAGWSDPGQIPRTPERLVHELHRLLECMGEPGPFLFVGHSMGGPLSRLYYHFYPEDVCGMVWVDSAHERMDRFFSFYKKAQAGFQTSMIFLRFISRLGLVRLLFKKQILRSFPSVSQSDAQAELLAHACRPRFFDWLYEETAGFVRASSWINAPVSLGDLPVISIEATYSTQPPLRYSTRYWNEFLSGWKAIHDDLEKLSSRMRREQVASGHVVMAEKPEPIIQAVQEMLRIK